MGQRHGKGQIDDATSAEEAPDEEEIADLNWSELTKDFTTIYNQTKLIEAGKIADYIPQLAKVNPDRYSLSVCTVDKRRFSIGDDDMEFCVQSVSKPITYCIALEQKGEKKVHTHVGREPSGRGFNAYKLNEQKLPFNPLINSGAIATCSLVSSDEPLSERFDLIKNYWQRLSGNSHIGFDNSTYQSEKKTGDRNFALSYLLKESGVFPPGINVKETLDLYFQCCSISLNTKTLAVIAASLANGGICPLTNEKVFEANHVKNCLSLMYLCGMYDFSGEFAFTIGIPAKSGVAGALLIVVPGVMGIATWAPPLDSHGNSIKGIAFCKALTEMYDFHMFSSRRMLSSLERQNSETSMEETVKLIDMCYAAGKGDVNEVKKIIKSKKVDVNATNYDGRTALHVACSEGRIEVVNLLISYKAQLEIKDRWGNTALDDAERGHFQEIVDILISAGAQKCEFRGGEFKNLRASSFLSFSPDRNL
eukprot:TRINITY_DN9559_c0_g1_i1.p1 TRINITY_DN9559_c0_g1~~TRINITY_DN9559_c0_g1_i1.p1  ORF type:complete len:507 (+),score=134.35 TRINITY_DN9559_c0_g1_i1:89-1522(+)